MLAALRERLVLAITLSQLVISAGLYYVFPAMVLFWQADFGWTLPQIMGAFSVALIVQGLTAKAIGGLFDRGLGPIAMAGGGVLAALGLVAVTAVETLAQFYLCWAVLGFAMGLTLYDAVFALIIRARGPEAMAPIAVITLLAGLASSFAFVFVGTVGDAFGWRAALWIMAAAILVLHVPIVFRAMATLEASPQEAAPPSAEAVRLQDRAGYLPLTAALTMSAFGLGIVISHVMPLLTWTGADVRVVLWAAALIGVAQVGGRLIVAVIGADWNRPALATVCLTGLAGALLTLTFAHKMHGLVFAFAALHGACYGISSTLRPMLIRDVLGQAGFGAAQGAVLAPAFVAFGLAPLLAAQVAAIAGYGALIAVAISVQLASAILLINLTRRSLLPVET